MTVCDCVLYIQPGPRRGSTLPQERQDTIPTEQVGALPIVIGEGGGRGGSLLYSLVYTLATLFLSCDLGMKRGAG